MSDVALDMSETPDWRPRMEATLPTEPFQRRRLLFEELNPEIAVHPFFQKRKKPPLRDAAVLIPVVRRPEGATIVLTVRSPDMPTHAGQIGFPGGRAQKEDETLLHTALREANEEVGLPLSAVSVIGSFGVHEGGMGFAVTPVVAEVDPDAVLEACPREVAEIFEVPLDHYADLGNHGVEWREHDGLKYKMYSAPYQDYHVWGLTAGILRTLGEALNV